MSSFYEKSIIPLIEARQAQFTKAEKIIAQYFLKDCANEDDLSAKTVANKLRVSEASLTRFAQKCGFKGYRAFAYAYQPPIEDPMDNNHIQPILGSYQELLNKTYSIIDMAKIHRISQLMIRYTHIIMIGKGSSGMVANEMKFRFMRIGIHCEAITDDDLIRINSALANENTLVMGISISGQTQIVTQALKTAKHNHAKTVLFTANEVVEFYDYCDEIQLFAMKNQLEHGRLISPQFPVLVVLDIIYADIMRENPNYRNQLWEKTYQALKF